MGAIETAAGEARKAKMVRLRAQLDEIDQELVTLDANGDIIDDAAQQRFEELVAERAMILPEYKKLEERATRLQEIADATYREVRGLPEVMIKPKEQWQARGAENLTFREARDAAMNVLDDREQNYPLSSSQLDYLEQKVRQNTDIARRILVTENDDYRQAFMRLMSRPNAILTHEQQDSLLRYEGYRAQAEGTSASGGYAIPVFIDPSIILTDQETQNPFLALCRQVDVNTNAWKGISSAGMSWSFDSEGSAVSDDSLTSLAQPSVTVFAARGFIPYSIEIAQDWPGFQDEMARVLSVGYDELLVSKFSTGSGSGEPRGILTALAASSPTSIITSTTDGAFGQEDVYATWAGLPQKYRSRAAWMLNVDVMNKIRQMGTANVYHASTVNLMAGAIDRLFERPVYENAYFPAFSSTTGAANRLVVGDWSNYVIARRSGMTVELVPHLVDVTNNRPTGSRGWFAYARIGGNSVNDAAFRLQANT